MRIGPAARPFARIDVPIPEQPQLSSSPTSIPSKADSLGPAERLGEVEVHQAELVRLGDDVGRVGLVLVVLRRLGPDLLLGELARERAELPLLVGERERDAVPRGPSPSLPSCCSGRRLTSQSIVACAAGKGKLSRWAHPRQAASTRPPRARLGSPAARQASKPPTTSPARSKPSSTSVAAAGSKRSRGCRGRAAGASGRRRVGSPKPTPGRHATRARCAGRAATPGRSRRAGGRRPNGRRRSAPLPSGTPPTRRRGRLARSGSARRPAARRRRAPPAPPRRHHPATAGPCPASLQSRRPREEETGGDHDRGPHRDRPARLPRRRRAARRRGARDPRHRASVRARASPPRRRRLVRAGHPPAELFGELAKLGLLGMHLEGYGLPGASSVAYGLVCRSWRPATRASAAPCPCRARSRCTRSGGGAPRSRRSAGSRRCTPARRSAASASPSPTPAPTPARCERMRIATARTGS